MNAFFIQYACEHHSGNVLTVRLNRHVRSLSRLNSSEVGTGKPAVYVSINTITTIHYRNVNLVNKGVNNENKKPLQY